ncbi:GTPase [Spongiimicrobium salis]|uniref:GTPase n=1 Tax=Spongiimicrobium salis TaxID=1667022 RepID=UPI00374D9D08
MAAKALQKLIFVYNADSGLRNLIIDAAHKVLSPKTYPCHLCDITYGTFTEKKAWKKFRKNTLMEMEFLHRDEFQERYASKFGHKFSFPIILWAERGQLEVFMTPKTLNGIASTTALIQEIKRRL